MPLPLIPFVIGAAAGATVTYFLTNKTHDQQIKPAKVLLAEDDDTESKAPSSVIDDTEESDRSDSPKHV